MSRIFSAAAILLLASMQGLSQEVPKGKVKLPDPGSISLPSAPSDPGVASVERGECILIDESARKACWAMMAASYQYWESSYRHRRESFSWSLRASKIIFGVVLLLVFSGLVFAGIQFWMAFAASSRVEARQLKTTGGAGAVAGSKAELQSMNVEMELSTGGLKVNSSVLGVVILLISMAFFYLYARYVYPIQDIRANAMEVSQGSSSK